jgi:hypothetical protein
MNHIHNYRSKHTAFWLLLAVLFAAQAVAPVWAEVVLCHCHHATTHDKRHPVTSRLALTAETQGDCCNDTHHTCRHCRLEADPAPAQAVLTSAPSRTTDRSSVAVDCVLPIAATDGLNERHYRDLMPPVTPPIARFLFLGVIRC